VWGGSWGRFVGRVVWFSVHAKGPTSYASARVKEKREKACNQFLSPGGKSQ